MKATVSTEDFLKNAPTDMLKAIVTQAQRAVLSKDETQVNAVEGVVDTVKSQLAGTTDPAELRDKLNDMNAQITKSLNKNAIDDTANIGLIANIDEMKRQLELVVVMIDDDVIVHIDSSVMGMIDYGITALINNEIVTYVDEDVMSYVDEEIETYIDHNQLCR